MITYSVLGIMLRKKCPLACAHCITDSSPQAEGMLEESFVFSVLEEAVGLTPVVSFTGGEAFLNSEILIRCILKAKEFGFKVTAVTGCGWVRTEKHAFSVIEAVKKAGLDRLCISWDQYHLAFKNGWKLQAVAKAAWQWQIPLVIRSVITPLSYNEKDPFLPDLGEVQYHLEKVPLIKLGRANALPEEDFFWEYSPPTGVCVVILSPVVEYDGRVFACCGPSHYASHYSPLVLGDARKTSLREILSKAKEDPILEIIALLGPYGLFRILKDRFPLINVPERARYSSICDLCMDILNEPQLVEKLREYFVGKDGKSFLVASRMMEKIQPS
ncbi:radical SAM/SPASM domain-containing protein [Methylacidiphilum kamchatkense]|uniref:Iron-sulfur cluster protein n=1 Tax=Methylacidiphilum kamchatkense Kam1 TaxID=1202785 RepID=A0A516TKW0_9BACT|nr:radical SAM protein [Methylacidiphilum kamchatkense]QDQ41889.1 iron-sulfur cluster protein [Methylacidiphilum kamchatkense Kam1]